MSEEIYKAIMMLHALGDTIGFKNGEWEFNYLKKDLSYKTTLEIVFDFISLGGITMIDLKNWFVSDDTLIHMAVTKTLLDINTDINDENYIEIFKENIIKALQEIIKDEEKDITLYSEKTNDVRYLKEKKIKKFRGVGLTTVSSVQAWEEKNNISIKTSGGNGVAMRSLCIGAFYHKEEDLDKLIKFSIETGRLTHPSPIGFLGGLTSAYFTHLALNKVDLYDWAFLLLKLVESDKVLKYISNNSHDEIIGYRRFISLWKKYIDLRFKKNNEKGEKDKKNNNYEPIFTNSNKNLIWRSKFFHDFTMQYDEFYNEKIKDDHYFITIGGSGVTVMLMAYDALLDANESWEKLIYYAMLHLGDSDTVGSIAGGLYGAMYGFKNVPERLLDNLEKKEELIELSQKLYKKTH